MALNKGDKAPDFTLFDIDRKPRSLKEFAGKKTVLAFYPGAFTGVCTKEVCALRDSMSEMNTLNAQVVGISVDAPAANKAFSDHNRLGFPLLSDYTREVSSKYVGLYNDFGGLPGLTTAKRAILILDAQGTVKWVWSTENPGVEPNYDEVKNALASI